MYSEYYEFQGQDDEKKIIYLEKKDGPFSPRLHYWMYKKLVELVNFADNNGYQIVIICKDDIITPTTKQKGPFTQKNCIGT